MPLDDSVRERVVLFGGKVAGVDCPHCEYRSLDSDLDAHAFDKVSCPECDSPILTEEQKAELRQAGKL